MSSHNNEAEEKEYIKREKAFLKKYYPNTYLETLKKKDKEMKLCLDLCSGLGGISRAFVDAGWNVISVDNEPKFNPTICKDVRTLLNDKEFMALKPDVILASPPCQRFSIAPNAWPLPGIGEALEIVGACLEIIVAMKPRYWCLENPSTGRLKWFIGEPATRVRLNAFGYKTVKPTGLWGNIPLGLINDSPKKNKECDAWAYFNSRSPSKRSEMPQKLSEAILKAIKEDEIN